MRSRPRSLPTMRRTPATRPNVAMSRAGELGGLLFLVCLCAVLGLAILGAFR